MWGLNHEPRSHEDFNSLTVAYFQSRFESTSRGGLNPDSFKSYATGSELKSSCECGYGHMRYKLHDLVLDKKEHLCT